ncbi:MAG: hypothetical protein ABEH86_06390 [Haloarcula sp.]
MPVRHTHTYGDRTGDRDHSDPMPAADVTLNTPVGVCQDHRGHVWVADTGNNRLLVFDRTLDLVLGQVGTAGTAPGAFELPFRLAHHPTDRRLFVTDLGNERVQELSYAYGESAGDSRPSLPRVTVEQTFTTGDTADFHPNGIALASASDGLRIYVADEFYHDDPTDTRSRVVVFDGAGSQRGSFREITRDSGPPIPLYWPQGLATDPEGNVLVTNTGYGVQHREDGRPPYYATVVRADSDGVGVPFSHTRSPVLDDEFIIPRGVSYLPANERFVVPDVGGGHVYSYDLDGDSKGEVPSTIAPDLAARRFGAPMAVAPYDPGPDADPTGPVRARVLITEALGPAVSAHELRFVAERTAELATVDGCRNDPGQFDYASGTTIAPAETSEQQIWVGDGGNRRLQYSQPGPKPPVEPHRLSANHFPAELVTWNWPDGDRYLFAADYSATAESWDDDRQLHCYRLTEVGGTTSLTHVDSAGSWGYFGAELRLPRGMSLERVSPDQVRLHVADSLNARVGTWLFDRRATTLDHEGFYGGFGHDTGEFWLPSDVEVVPEATYVADRNNNRIQYDAGEGWQQVGTPGYGPGTSQFLLPSSVSYTDGYLFVLDLVNRAVDVFETRPDGSVPETPVDSFGVFGGTTAVGDLWMPGTLDTAARDDGVTVCLPDKVLNVVYQFEWSPPTAD